MAAEVGVVANAAEGSGPGPATSSGHTKVFTSPAYVICFNYYHDIALHISYTHTRTCAARHPIDIREANWDGAAGDHGLLYWRTLTSTRCHGPVDQHRREGGK
jgi:hypothetical protein